MEKPQEFLETPDNQSIMDSLFSIQPEMEQYTVMDELLAYLNKYKLLTRTEREHLGPQSRKTPTEKTRYLLSNLESKGPKGHTDFLKALIASSSAVSGHHYLIKLLQAQGKLCLNEQLITQLQKNGKYIIKIYCAYIVESRCCSQSGAYYNMH